MEKYGMTKNKILYLHQLFTNLIMYLRRQENLFRKQHDLSATQFPGNKYVTKKATRKDVEK